MSNRRSFLQFLGLAVAVSARPMSAEAEPSETVTLKLNIDGEKLARDIRAAVPPSVSPGMGTEP